MRSHPVPNALKTSDFVTHKEIYQQPQLWREVIQQFYSREADLLLRAIKKWNVQQPGHIILTGAGSSAFVGETLLPFWKTVFATSVEAIPTTHLITHPNVYFKSQVPTWLVSFARSGNSPESLHAVSLAEKIFNAVFHLIITCNTEGSLLQQHLQMQFDMVLPPASHDQALAMTGSFTAMTLAGMLIGDFFAKKSFHKNWTSLVEAGQYLLNEYTELLQHIAQRPFQRAVFLGSGMLYGIARESHLKLQELTDGQVMCQFDSYLGFRHGPRAVLDDSTLIVFLLSPDAYVRQYELDLISEIAQMHLGHMRVVITPKPVDEALVDAQIVIPYTLPEPLWSIVAVLPAQLLGLFKSVHLGLNPDNPSRRGVISRVVQGVKLYDYESALGQ